MESVPGEFPVVLTFYHLLSILSRKQTNKKRQELHLRTAWEGKRMGLEAGGTGRRGYSSFQLSYLIKLLNFHIFHYKDANCYMLNTF